MNKAFLIGSYGLAFLLLLFGGLLIAGSCHYATTSGPMNIDQSLLFSLTGLFLVLISVFIIRKQIEANKNGFAAIAIMFAAALLSFGQYAMYNSEKAYQNLHPEIEVLGPDSGCLAIFYSTVFLSLLAGLILLAEVHDDGKKRLTHYH